MATPSPVPPPSIQPDEPLLNTVSLVSMGVTGAMAVIAWFLAVYLHRKYKTSTIDKWVLFWLWFDAMIHFTVELSFCVLSFTGTVEKSNHFTALLWKEYGKADSRWLIFDPTLVAMEALTVAIPGPLCLWLIYAICKDTSYRHWIQLIVSTCEIYGGYMTFVPDMLMGSPSLRTDNWLYLWVYLVFYNGIWVVFPGALIYQSWRDMTDGDSARNAPTQRITRSKTKFNKKKE